MGGASNTAQGAALFLESCAKLKRDLSGFVLSLTEESSVFMYLMLMTEIRRWLKPSESCSNAVVKALKCAIHNILTMLDKYCSTSEVKDLLQMADKVDESTCLIFKGKKLLRLDPVWASLLLGLSWFERVTTWFG